MQQQETKQEKLFHTIDFYLAVWLMMNNIELLRVERDNPSRLVFIFDDTDSEKRAQLADNFWKETKLKDFISKMQTLKIKMYESHPPLIFKKIVKKNDKQNAQSMHEK